MSTKKKQTKSDEPPGSDYCLGVAQSVLGMARGMGFFWEDAVTISAEESKKIVRKPTVVLTWSAHRVVLVFDGEMHVFRDGNDSRKKQQGSLVVPVSGTAAVIELFAGHLFHWQLVQERKKGAVGVAASLQKSVSSLIDLLPVYSRKRVPEICTQYGKEYVWQVVRTPEVEMLRWKNFGRVSIKRLKEALDTLGLSLGMGLPRGEYPWNK